MTRVVPMNGNVNVETSDRIAFTTGKNHVVTTTFIEPSSSVSSPRRVQDVIYLDGFGRTVQEIGVKAAPGGKADIIIPRTYGPGGRTEREFLPFYRVGNNGGFVQDPLNPANWEFLGEGEGPHAMTINTWENSPIDRIVRTVGPGKQWQEGNKANCIEHGVNGMNEVKRFRVNGEGKLVIDGFYAPGTLVKTTSTDEDGNVRLSYSANDGNSLLEVAINGTERLETYIVTDDLGRTRFILSPEASRLTGNAVDSSVIEKLAFQYDYDDRGNVIMKKLPGVEPVYMIYDKRDRLVLSQDGNQRNDNPAAWNYARFDDRNRPVETGTVIVEGFTSTRDLRETARNVVNFTPAGARTPLQFTVYDSYEPTGDVSPLPFVPADGFDSTRLELVTGLVTSVKTRILDSGTWLTTTYYYDSRGRIALVTGQNATGGVSRLYTYRDFSGNVIKKREEHQVDGKTTVITTSMELDDRGRVMASETSLDGGDPVRATWSYDPVGRLVTTSRGNVLEDTIRYNPRGWVTGKRNSFFSIELAYGNPVSGASPSWNGNISEIRWRHGNGDLLAYAFSYDGVNRITDAYQLKKVGNAWVEMTDGFNENGIQYDGNGNITAMTRTAGGTTVDNLLYSYSGNRLVSLRECANPGGNVDVMERGNAEGGSYSHDDNGNMTSDSRKALNFEYNSLNLLREVKTTAGTTKARYRWLADGSKLSVRDGEGNAGFDYLGSLTFKVDRAGRRLETAAFDGGIFRVGENGQVEVNYFITDHLGSVREIIDGEGNVIERNDYYPFGARHPRLDYQLSDNRYKFNGKEEQVTGNIGFFDYGFRMYDPTLGRWITRDKLENLYPNLSAYTYCGNSPVRHVDILGLDWYISNKTGANDDPVWFDNEEEAAAYYNGEFLNIGANLLGEVNVNEKSRFYPSENYLGTPFGSFPSLTELEKITTAQSTLSNLKARLEEIEINLKDPIVFFVDPASNIIGCKTYFDYFEGNRWITGHWISAKGIYYSFDILKRRPNGKRVQGWYGLQISKNLAKKATRVARGVSSTLGWISITHNGICFINNQTWEGGIDLAVGGLSVFYPPLGVLDLYWDVLSTGMMKYTKEMMQNGMIPGRDDWFIWKY